MIKKEKQFIEKLLNSKYALDSAHTIVKTTKKRQNVFTIGPPSLSRE